MSAKSPEARRAAMSGSLGFTFERPLQLERPIPFGIRAYFHRLGVEVHEVPLAVSIFHPSEVHAMICRHRDRGGHMSQKKMARRLRERTRELYEEPIPNATTGRPFLKPTVDGMAQRLWLPLNPIPDLLPVQRRESLVPLHFMLGEEPDYDRIENFSFLTLMGITRDLELALDEADADKLREVGGLEVINLGPTECFPTHKQLEHMFTSQNGGQNVRQPGV